MAELTRARLDKQIQKASKNRQFPLSDVNGELQFADIDAIIKTGETLTRLNSVEVIGGNLIIKYTAEDNQQQVVSTPLNFSQQDIKVSDAKMENPSAGVYRLIITESDGSQFPVDLSALLAVVTQSTEYVVISGNGTPTDPLRVELSDKFWERQPKVLDNLDDVTVGEIELWQEVAKGGSVVLVFDNEMRQWMPRSLATLENFREVTQTFDNVKSGNTVTLAVDTSRIFPASIKVFRNGLRQAFGIDYNFGQQGSLYDIAFMEPFSDKYPERVVVDYRPNDFNIAAAPNT